MAVQDYSPYGVIKRGTDYGLSKLSAIYNNNRAKNSTQVGRSTSMNNFVTNAPVERNQSFQFGQDYSLNGQAGTELGYTQLPSGEIPIINTTQSAIPAVYNPQSHPSKNGGLRAPPPLVPINSGISPVQQNVQAVQGDVVAPVNPASAMEVAQYNAKAQSDLADKNNLAIIDVAKMSQKSGWEKAGSLASGVGSLAGGLAGIYGAYANAKYMKDQANMQKNMIRGDEANKSAFAKAAGGTYIKSGV